MEPCVSTVGCEGPSSGWRRPGGARGEQHSSWVFLFLPTRGDLSPGWGALTESPESTTGKKEKK